MNLESLLLLLNIFAPPLIQAFIITVELAPEIMKRIPELQGEPLKTEELK